jgi:hypothetical protein
MGSFLYWSSAFVPFVMVISQTGLIQRTYLDVSLQISHFASVSKAVVKTGSFN